MELTATNHDTLTENSISVGLPSLQSHELNKQDDHSQVYSLPHSPQPSFLEDPPMLSPQSLQQQLYAELELNEVINETEKQMISLEQTGCEVNALYEASQVTAQYEAKKMREKLEDEMLEHQQRCDEAMLEEFLLMQQQLLEAENITTREVATAADMLEIQAREAQQAFETQAVIHSQILQNETQLKLQAQSIHQPNYEGKVVSEVRSKSESGYDDDEFEDTYGDETFVSAVGNSTRSHVSLKSAGVSPSKFQQQTSSLNSPFVEENEEISESDYSEGYDDDFTNSHNTHSHNHLSNQLSIDTNSSFKQGDKVQIWWEDEQAWFTATVRSVGSGGACVLYDDGEEEDDVSLSLLKLHNVATPSIQRSP
eukprot:CAMPEP_0114402774 /NCGR_PEP_ID=MMETSP0102-20121206/18285_1 /TAXON_ID=38822 ORGANISM="Pteridomonas danica, Strain PT" /NCGR_SAMPLE_ID=MMETSP0102 /ASSEMBLY_ACC=CAM_ASM_000212 /LENGTH=367 /DNA_ID=CAMNT_0001566591 /DNA_START=39 /DNA_END=1138 /DNA_ORIENTATION=-